MPEFRRTPASLTNPGFDAAGNALSNPPRAGFNKAESVINFSPVDNVWPEIYVIPGADIDAYEIAGDPGDIVVEISDATGEGSLHLPYQA